MRNLAELDIKVRTEVKISQDLIIPILIDMGDITTRDFTTALSTVDTFKSKSGVSKVKPLFDFNKIDISKDGIVLDKTDLSYMTDPDFMYLKKFIDYRFIDGDLEDVEGMQEEHFIKFKTIVSIWIDLLFNEYVEIIKEILELDKKDQIIYNQAMTQLQCCYEYNSNVYFTENIGKAFSDYTQREKILFQSYVTKNKLINMEIDKRKNTIPE